MKDEEEKENINKSLDKSIYIKKNIYLVLVLIFLTLFLLVIYTILKITILKSKDDIKQNIGKNDVSIVASGRKSEYIPTNDKNANVKEIQTIEEFEEFKKKYSNYIIVLEKEKCIYCKKMMPMINKLSNDGYIIRIVNIKNARMKNFIDKVMKKHVPLTLIYMNHNLIKSREGFLDYEELKTLIENEYFKEKRMDVKEVDNEVKR